MITNAQDAITDHSEATSLPEALPSPLNTQDAVLDVGEVSGAERAKPARPAVQRRKKKEKLTKKEALFVKGLQKGLCVRESALKAGYAETTANTDAYQILDRPRVRAHFADVMEKMGITDESLARCLAEGLSAKKVISAILVGSDAGPATKDFVEVEDHATRHRFLETGLKAKGYLVDKHEVTSVPYEEYLRRVQNAKLIKG